MREGCINPHEHLSRGRVGKERQGDFYYTTIKEVLPMNLPEAQRITGVKRVEVIRGTKL